jgi:3-oxoacyl-[acyl-carrier protein] reductase
MIYFVTGGSRGIGEAIVLEAIGLGHDVAFTYRQHPELAERVVARAHERDPSRRCRAYRLDVRDPDAVEATGDRVLDDLGGVDAVVANAGVNVPGLAITLSDEDWRTVIDTNLSGAFYVCRQFLPTLLANGWGRIVLISSVSYRGATGQASYAASKAGLIGLSGSLAREYGRKGITSNVIVPGLIETDMAADAAELRELWMRLCPAGRVGAPSDVARLVTFLASDAASFINGEVIPVTAGLDWAP